MSGWGEIAGMAMGLGGGLAQGFASAESMRKSSDQQRRAFRTMLELENTMLEQFGNDPLLNRFYTQMMNPTQDFSIEDLRAAGVEQINTTATRQNRQGLRNLASLGIQGGAAQDYVPQAVGMARSAQMQALQQQMGEYESVNLPQAQMGQLQQFLGASQARLGTEIGAIT